MDIDITPATPDEQLAGMIVEKLLEAGCILESDADAIRLSIASGRATADDWMYWIENALERSAEEVIHGTS